MSVKATCHEVEGGQQFNILSDLTSPYIMAILAFLMIALTLGTTFSMNTTTFTYSDPLTEQTLGTYYPLSFPVTNETIWMYDRVIRSGIVNVVNSSPKLMAQRVAVLASCRTVEHTIASLLPLAQDYRSLTTSFAHTLRELKAAYTTHQIFPMPAITDLVSRSIRRLSLFVYSADMMEVSAQAMTTYLTESLDSQLGSLVVMSELEYNLFLPFASPHSELVENFSAIFSLMSENSGLMLGLAHLIVDRIDYYKEMVEEHQAIFKGLLDLMSDNPTPFSIFNFPRALIMTSWWVLTKNVAWKAVDDYLLCQGLIGLDKMSRVIGDFNYGCTTPTALAIFAPLIYHSSPTSPPTTFTYVPTNSSVSGWEF